jgi:hypothetical protein
VEDSSKAAAAAANMASAAPPAADIPIEGKTVKALTVLSVKRTYDLFAGNRSAAIPLDEER